MPTTPMPPASPNRTKNLTLPTAVLAAAWLSETELVAGCLDGVYRVDLETESHRKVGEHTSYVSSVAVLPQRRQYLSAGYDGLLHWYDNESNERVRTLKLHDFWSWDMTVSPDESLVASVTGQYLAGGYKYEPAPEREPSVRVVDALSGEILHSLPHVPSVQAVAFSNDSQFVAAGNLMGEVRIWNARSGEQVANWTTPDFTSWGIIKSHCYLGGIFALRFTPDDTGLLLCGMGPMHDPMAGNGRQLWQRWDWQSDPPSRADQTHDGDTGEGLMEALALHPNGSLFVMGGRLRGGNLNVGLFGTGDGAKIGSVKSGYRVTEILFSADGNAMLLAGGQGQPDKNAEGRIADFGRIEIYDIA
ncbi:MAG: WD40 repeat domain-containing protein [Pirellulales bacterium]